LVVVVFAFPNDTSTELNLIAKVNPMPPPNTPLEGDSTSGTTPGVKGVNTATSGNGHGVFGTSANWEGVHGDTNSATAAGVAGIQLNPNGTGAGVFGQNDGKGHGVFGKSPNWEGVHGETNSTVAAGVAGIQLNPNGTGAGVFGQNQGKGHGVFGTSAQWEGVHGETNSTTAAGVAGIQLNPAGTGAGVYAESRGNGPAGFFKGDVQINGGGRALVINGNAVVSGTVIASDVILSGADCAEEFDIANEGQLEPGTVVVFDGDGAISQSTEPYNKRVAGVISGAGKYRPGVILGREGISGEGRAPVALMGRVFCKVDAFYSRIEVGDLLTTSPTSGCAMKADDPLKAFGSVIGKALQSMPEGQRGLIPILVALQ
jgi:hypothetical protein